MAVKLVVDWSGLGQTLLGADFLRFDDILSSLVVMKLLILVKRKEKTN